MALTRLTKITGPGIKTDTNWVGNNANYSGIVTATSFVGSGASLTGIDATAVKDSSGNVKIQAEASGAVYTGIHTFTTLKSTSADFSGNVTIGGTLTYEDVTNIDSVGLVTARDGIFIPDNKKLELGNTTSSPDFEISHNTSGYNEIQSNNGNIRIRNYDTSGPGKSLYVQSEIVQLRSHTNNHTMIDARAGAQVDLYYNNEKKLETSAKGIQVGTGVTIETNGQANLAGIVTTGEGIFVPNSKEIKIGGSYASPNLRIFSNGVHQYIRESGAGNLFVSTNSLNVLNAVTSETLLKANQGSSGYVKLYQNNQVKLETTSTGTVVTGILTATGRVGVGTNTTAERNSLPAPKAGQLIMNATTDLLEYYNGTSWTPIDTPPSVSSVNNTNITETQIAAGFDLVITGSNFKTGATVTFIGNDGTEHISPTTTVNTTTQITARVHGSVSNANEPYDVKVTNASGLSGILEDAFNINAKPVWTTASGTLATIKDNATGIHTTVAASDPEGDTVTYSGTVGGGMSLNSTTGAISGDPTDVNSNTTVSFTLNATSSGSNVTARNFNIIVQPGPILDSLEVWFDPRNFSSLTNNSTASSNSASNTNATWTLTTDGAAGFVSGTNSQAIECTSGSRVQFHTKGQDITAFDNINNFTFEFWVYVGSTSTPTWAFLGGKSNFWGANEAGIYVHSNGNTFGFHTANTYGVEVSFPSVGWHHIVGVRNLSDANCRKIYIDNSVVAEDNGGDNDANHTLNNDNAMTIGGDCPAPNSNNFNTPGYPLPSTWKFGHTRFYTKALSATEITKNWNAEKAIYGL
tara:strand:- start:1534 stop:3951 length:2418 start_codon:yes stop_codon:yes gene_type:complete